MGGDGGVIASNRRYMRGAGTADHTADSSRASKSDTQEMERENATERMRTCALTEAPLRFDDQNNNTIVACPYGRLYNKEAAVEALLRRKTSQKDEDDGDELGAHIRGLKDLYPVRFAFQKKANSKSGNNAILVPVCPITGMEFNHLIPAFLIVPGNPDAPANVVSHRAVREMGWAALESEYGPMEEKIRLAPPPAELAEIQKALQEKRSKKKDKKKRKKEKDNKTSAITAAPPAKVRKEDVADVARGRVQNAVQNNEVLSSIFTSSTSQMSRKEKNDHLFARSG